MLALFMWFIQLLIGLFMIKYFMGVFVFLMGIIKKLIINIVILTISIWNITFGSIKKLRINI